ncbi:MAG: hypothetical protein Tsb009_00200 [Planctomycetaceae bacterium]
MDALCAASREKWRSRMAGFFFLLWMFPCAYVWGQSRLEPNLLVLKNGRVVEGRISQNAGGYVVEVKNGSMLVPRTQALFLTTSKREAYAKLRSMMPRRSVKGNLILARWCLTNQLFTQARHEIREALKLEPNNDSARRMMTRLEKMLDPDADKTPKKKTRLEERLLSPAARSLSGLPQKTAGQFIGKIQPMLMNSCATAGCHGQGGRSQFQLLRVRLGNGGHRGRSERNLATTLAYINPRQPELSPLLTKPTGNHGRNGRPVFRGRAGSRQRELLRQWVYAVAQSSQPASSTRTSSISSSGDPNRLPPVKPGYQLTPAMKAIRSQAEQSRVLRDLYRKPDSNSTSRIRSSGRDAFDPEEFNKQNRRQRRSPLPPRRGSGL